MKKVILGVTAPALVAAALMSVPSVAMADLVFNVAATTDYRYRGISQSRLKPAVSGGVDFDKDGFYVGAWASTIKWIKDFGGDAKVEVDLYGGYKGEIQKGLSFDVGVLTYQYPSNKLSPSANTTEIYGALTFGPATAKYSYALTDTFGNANSDGSYYLDLSATFEVAGLSVVPHIGYQKITGPFSGPASYTDYALTVSKEVVKGLTLSGAIVGTDADKTFYIAKGKKLGETGIVVSVKYAF